VTVFTTQAWDPESFHKPWKKRLDEGVEHHEGLEVHRFPIRNIPLQFKVLGALNLIPVDAVRLLFGFPSVLLPEYLREVFIRKPQFDLIVAGVMPYTHLIYPAARLAQRTQTPWICVPLTHTGTAGEPPVRGHLIPYQLRLMKRADAIVTATEAENDALEARGLDRSKLRTVGVGVEPDEIAGGDGARFRQRFHVSGPIVLQISTQTRDKGSIDVVESMKLLWATGSKATLVLIGQIVNDFESYFLALDPLLYERILCLGFVDEQTKKDALDACDVLVMPSRADSFGAVFLEAWLYGKPVIGARAGGIPAVISDGHDGILVEFANVRQIADAINLLLDDATLAGSMGQRGREKVLSRYTREIVCDRMSQVVEDVMLGSGTDAK